GLGDAREFDEGRRRHVFFIPSPRTRGEGQGEGSAFLSFAHSFQISSSTESKCQNTSSFKNRITRIPSRSNRFVRRASYASRSPCDSPSSSITRPAPAQ